MREKGFFFQIYYFSCQTLTDSLPIQLLPQHFFKNGQICRINFHKNVWILSADNWKRGVFNLVETGIKCWKPAEIFETELTKTFLFGFHKWNKICAKGKIFWGVACLRPKLRTLNLHKLDRLTLREIFRYIQELQVPNIKLSFRLPPLLHLSLRKEILLFSMKFPIQRYHKGRRKCFDEIIIFLSLMLLERGEKNFLKIISSHRVVGMKLAFHYFLKDL